MHQRPRILPRRTFEGYGLSPTSPPASRGRCSKGWWTTAGAGWGTRGPRSAWRPGSRDRNAGPERGTADPFSGGEADVGFVCSPSYLWLREREPSPVELLGVAPVFGGGRGGDRPVYFCDVISARGNDVSGFADLRGRSWAYNDACSLSGYYGLLRKLDEMGEDQRFFGEVLHSGSHLDSIRMVADHEADAATIDSNVLWMRLKARPELADLVRVIDSWGPFPVQPVVVRSGLDPALKGALRDAFLDLDVHAVPALAEFGFRRFAPVTDEDYAPERLLPNASEKPA